ncbi:hypothetical protein OG453_07240 [Streptomyces sp. NBC_01381]|uniref:hypothetical protein n=1 Tax=Streptomyces sp. NBC_01381 TaxID=2903845 RepID=UPI0022515F75|nr:hypothetical protein [Streptomyces sp. NBC_01381]MCX4666462.1 hypothetical protein [Streptomyces sp. NBC_01381]
MTAHPLADHAAALRSKALDFLRSPLAVEVWSMLLNEGQAFTMPAQWGALPRQQQIQQLLKAEGRRIADGTTFAVDVAVVAAAKAAGQDRQLRLPFTEDLLPAPSGMFVSTTSMGDLVNGWPMSVVTWGPPMDGFAPGVHLAWWSIPPTQPSNPDRRLPIYPDFDLHLPLPPIVDGRLWEIDVPSGHRYSQIPLRTVVATWYALSTEAVEVAERRPEPTLGRALAAQKAKRRGVQVATAAATNTVLEAITAKAAERAARLQADHGGEFGGLDSVAPTPRVASHGVFAPAQDGELQPELRKIAHSYRAAAEHWHRLEAEVDQVYPGIFPQLEELRVREYGEWPTWCWVPSLRLGALLMHVYGATVDEAMWDGPRIAAVGAWLSGGRHALLPAADLPPQLPDDRAPFGLEGRMPVPGMGLILPGSGDDLLQLTFIDYAEDKPMGELVLVSDEGKHGNGFRDLAKHTLFLADTTLTEAVKSTQIHYDQAALKNGEKPRPADDALYAQYAEWFGFVTGLLEAACAPNTVTVDAGALTGRKPALPWPPEPGLLAETQLWLVNTP